MPYDYLIPSGTIIPDTSTLLTDVQNEFIASFGATINLNGNTPQGLLIAGEVLSRAAAALNNAQIANQFNPNLSGGVFLDALLALLGSKRNSQTYTTINVNLTGQPGTSIASGSLIQNSVTGDQFQLLSTVTLAPDGTGASVAQAVNPGPVPANAGDLTQIVASTSVLGWETVINPADAISLGTTTQDDASASNFRLVTLAGQSSGQAEAIITALYLTNGVTSVGYSQNDYTVPLDDRGVTLLPNSIYACVAGGTDIDVANTLDKNKSPGCQYNGSTSVIITEPFSEQIITVLFDRPMLIYILVRATIRADGIVGNPVDSVRQAILNYAQGLLAGKPGLKIGASVSCFELAGAVDEQVPGVFVVNMETSLISPVEYSNSTLDINLNQQAIITSSNISVVIA
jgi:hypothetical protein